MISSEQPAGATSAPRTDQIGADPRPESARVGTGALLDGRYRLQDVLGQGATSTVYLGRDELLGRSVAIKVFDARGSQLNNADRQRLEMQALAAVQHPNLVTVFDAHLADGQSTGPSGSAGSTGLTYLVLELVTGDTLSARLRRGPVPADQVLVVGVALSGALTAVHEALLVHRDIKPGNVLMTPAGAIKLGDFGLVRILGDTASVTMGGDVMGTAAYLSPEQIRTASVGFPSDIYSLGLVLLECLTGRREFDGEPATAALARLVRDPVIPDDLPEPWSGLLRGMTDSDPARRPTAPAVLAVLQNAAGARPIVAAVSTWADDRLLGGTAGVAAGADRGTGILTAGWSSPLSPFLHEPTEVDRSSVSSPRRVLLGAGAVAVVTAAVVFVSSLNSGGATTPPSQPAVEGPASADPPTLEQQSPSAPGSTAAAEPPGTDPALASAGSAPSAPPATEPAAVVVTEPTTAAQPEPAAPAADSPGDTVEDPSAGDSGQPVEKTNNGNGNGGNGNGGNGNGNENGSGNGGNGNGKDKPKP